MLRIMKKNFNNKIVTVIGLGYVGLPLAVSLGKKFRTFGYDLSKKRIEQLKKFNDFTDEISFGEIKKSKKLKFTDNESCIKFSDFIIVTVPTPITKLNSPDFYYLKDACKKIGKFIKKGCTIIFESTVYPGATNEVCIPIIEKISNKIWKKDFFIGYSPERTNVGDKSKGLKNVTKLISADCKSTLRLIEKLYSNVTNKLYATTSIEVAEAAKSLENTQRDINIAFINEFSKICDKLNINTMDVINAASTKWNFTKFVPGLVGGHCISVDPYYLIFKSKKLNYFPNLIQSSRTINESMSKFIFKKIKENLNQKYKKNNSISVLVLGLTFKANCKDIRNSKIFDVIKIMKKNNYKVSSHDPYANKKDIYDHYKENITDLRDIKSKFDVILFNAPHNFYMKNVKKILKMINKKGLLFDLTSSLKNNSYVRKYNYISL